MNNIVFNTLLSLRRGLNFQIESRPNAKNYISRKKGKLRRSNELSWLQQIGILFYNFSIVFHLRRAEEDE